MGDIHGRCDLLQDLHQRIAEDARQARIEQTTVVYLGDYVDRGPGSFEVLDLLIEDPLPGCTRIHLRGNHEDMMLAFLDQPEVDALWLHNGGHATLSSYAVTCADWYDFRALELARAGLRAVLPESHLCFLRDLQYTHTCGDYLFAHAGVRPGRPLDAQDERDLMWIRGPFLDSDEEFGKCVVHGHTITERPDVHANRIGIDTGAVFTNRLTCLVLEGEDRRFLHT